MAKKSQKITFPKGEGVYLALQRPDTKFDELGMYKADFRLPLKEAKPQIDKLQKVVKAHTGKAYPAKKNSMWEFEVDEETGEETGTVLFKVRVKNKLRKSDGKLWDRRPLLIDSKKNDLPSNANPWGGSIIRVQAELYAYDQPKKGVNLQPVMVQVIDMVTGGSRGDSSAFDEEEGFEADDSDFDDEDDNDDTSSDGETDDEDDADY